MIMKKILSIFIFLSVLAARQSTRPEEKVAPAKEALAIVTRLFEAMQAKDSDGIRATFVPEGQLAVTQKRNGQTTVRLLTADAFAKSISEGKGVYQERMYKPETLVTGDLVTVRGRYGFYVDDRFSHCGLNSFHLMRTEQGWKIVNAASTLEFEGCEPESKMKN
jgi:putative lumazine-binding protein